jgi:hypothetical protein
MSVEELIAVLQSIADRLRDRVDGYSPEVAHIDAAEALRNFIADVRVNEAYERITPKWYA